MNYQSRITYLFILAIVIIVLFYYNYSVVTEGLEPTHSTAEDTDEGDAYMDNKATTGEITDNTTDSKLRDVESQINECRTIIQDINRVLPRNLNNITIGEVTQTDDINKIGISIEQSIDTETLNTITNKKEPSAKWLINAILPRGQKGPRGMKGEKGAYGNLGIIGKDGIQGEQGPWGKDCPNNSCE
jgi:hypothetical protein